MSSTGVVETSVKTNHTNKNQSKNTNNNNSKRKNKYDRSGRKRSKSFTGCGIPINHKPVLPTKFLLGGNINDPLNLNSLQDEEINRAMNAVTPKSSPIPTPPRRKAPIEVIIPPNIHDPLNLIDCADDAEYEQQLCSPLKKNRKKRIKKRRTISATIEEVNDEAVNLAKTPENSTDSAKIPEIPEVKKDLTIELSPKKEKQKRKSEDYSHHISKKFKNSMDKIVSPVVPQPGAWLKRVNSIPRGAKPRQNKSVDESLPQFKEKSKQFQYGNYNRYYGYRNPHNEADFRLKVFHHHKYLFWGKDILDIGCNIGHITLSVARDFGARSVTGIDIDQKLIGIARKNIKHYVKSVESPRPDDKPSEIKSSEFFPISMPILYGAIDIPGFGETNQGRGFPNNVQFKQCNYVLEDDSFVAIEQPQFDAILCLSITKWIHLNWGDSGIKQAFRRMYAQLRPGGKLILEPQNWASYNSKKKLTETIFKNYNSIELFPEKFTEYLLSPAVGFAKSEIMGYPSHQSKGFRRPIQIFTKSTMFPSERIEATPSHVTPNAPIYNDTLFQSIIKTKKNESHPQHTVDCVDHVYTNIFDRFCTCSDESLEMNNSVRETLNKGMTGSENTIESTGSEVINMEATGLPSCDSAELESTVESTDSEVINVESTVLPRCESEELKSTVESTSSKVIHIKTIGLPRCEGADLKNTVESTGFEVNDTEVTGLPRCEAEVTNLEAAVLPYSQSAELESTRLPSSIDTASNMECTRLPSCEDAKESINLINSETDYRDSENRKPTERVNSENISEITSGGQENSGSDIDKQKADNT